MSDPIGAIIDKALAEESGEYTNNPNDAGGPTRWGITQAELADFRGHPVSASDVAMLTQSEAWSILYAKFVRAPKFDLVAKISMPIGAKLIDAGVNIGPPTVAMYLQRCLNAFNLRGKKYPDIGVDGAVGAGTLSALSVFLAWRSAEGEKVLLEGINCLQGEHYISLSEKRPEDEEFAYGWILQRVAA
jgi:lysozyme family protein